jgi:hypothetical protein
MRVLAWPLKNSSSANSGSTASSLETKACRQQLTASATHSMAHPGFGHLWKQSEMSDIDIVIACPVDEGSGGDDAHMLENSTLLQQIPGHSPILSLSPYL